MFLRSIGNRNLRYTVFVGDGEVCETCVDMYGDSYLVAKEECVGHIQKRMGTGLRESKRKKMGQKLADGKTVGGIGRLTAGVIDRIQNNYGEAIRTNNDVQSMKNAVMAIYNHMIKDDNLSIMQQHRYCPKISSTWCKYWQDKLHNNGDYTEVGRLPPIFNSKLKYLFERLCDENLLIRCLQGLTQNQNESVNNMLWSICPKTVFCAVRKLEFCVMETISKFNVGAGTKAVVLCHIGCEPTSKLFTALRREDKQTDCTLRKKDPK